MTPSLLIAVGVALLTGGAEVLVRGAVGISVRIGLSPLVVGLTVVSFGTSFPEAAVSVGSSLAGRGSLALGNAIGSNVFNVLVILGASSLVAPLVVQRQLVRLDLPVMLGSAVLLTVLMVDGALGRGDGLLLLTGAVVYTAVLVRLGRKEEAEAEGRGGPAESGSEAEAAGAGGKGDRATEIPAGRRSAPVDAALVVVGVGLLVLGARLLVQGASDIALGLGVSELVVGLTVVATGTSLPEVATSLLAAWRGQRDLAVGNVVGSNIFNAFFVLGAGAAVAPEAIAVPSGVLTFDVPVMLAVSLVCLPIFFTGWSISRREGVVFLLYYAAYLGYLVAHAADHPAEEVIRTGVLFYAAPLTVLTLGLILLRQLRRTPS